MSRCSVFKATHLEDDTVGGDTITRLELDQVADHDLLGVHVSQLAACTSEGKGREAGVVSSCGCAEGRRAHDRINQQDCGARLVHTDRDALEHYAIQARIRPDCDRTREGLGIKGRDTYRA